ncbi:MAG: hypothetical protein WC600_08355 [Desulfobaccales bacterium]
MVELREWIQREGSEGRKKLFAAIKDKYPGFTQVSLTNYIQGQRIPDYNIAKIISRVTNIPVFLLPFRFIHRPETMGE